MARGVARPARPWRVGIRHPADPASIVAVIDARDLAVATSGNYERGAHLVDPRRGRTPASWWSVTVVGPSLTYADAYATAVFAMGPSGLTWVDRHPGYGAYAIAHDGIATWTPVVDAVLHRRAA